MTHSGSNNAHADSETEIELWDVRNVVHHDYNAPPDREGGFSSLLGRALDIYLGQNGAPLGGAKFCSTIRACYKRGSAVKVVATLPENPAADTISFDEMQAFSAILDRCYDTQRPSPKGNATGRPNSGRLTRMNHLIGKVCEPELVDRLDRLARLLTQTGSPLATISVGGELSRADVLRLALIRGLQAIEDEATNIAEGDQPFRRKRE